MRSDSEEMKNKHKYCGLYEAYIKRPLGCILSCIAFILLSPVMVVTGILVYIKLGPPILFAQKRPGKDEMIFSLYKFRTMSNATNKNGELLPDAERLTKFGRVLRSTSLDELPELVNIIKGEMAIVGPRPLAVQYLPFYTEEERHRHDIRPGLTGLAQIHGRNDLQWESRFKYDIAYVNHITFLGDLNIIIKTIQKVIRREHISVRGEGNLIDFDVYRKQQMKEKKEQ